MVWVVACRDYGWRCCVRKFKFPMRRHSSLWFNAEIRQLMKQRDFVVKQSVRTRNLPNFRSTSNCSERRSRAKSDMKLKDRDSRHLLARIPESLPESRGTLSTWPLLLLKPVMILFLHSLLSMSILHLYFNQLVPLLSLYHRYAILQTFSHSLHSLIQR